MTARKPTTRVLAGRVCLRLGLAGPNRSLKLLAQALQAARSAPR